MMRMRTKNTALPPQMGAAAAAAAGGGGGGRVEKEWELRPGGMLVQQRADVEENRAPPPTIRVRVKYGSVYHEIRISSTATFGELKRMLTGPTGLHHQDQKLFYKDKERDSKAFLDTVGLKDKSKVVLQEDPISQEKRFIEMRKSSKMERAAKTISEISLEVDRLAGQVSSLESVITKGEKVAEKDVISLIELLMNQLLKLDGINADGDVKLQRKMQVRRVQKYVETLDVLKIKNATPESGGTRPNGSVSSPVQHQQTRGSFGHSLIDSPNQVEQQTRRSFGHSLIDPPSQAEQQTRRSLIDSPNQVEQQTRRSFGRSLLDSPNQVEQPSRQSASFVITTQWETFDSTAGSMQGSASTSTSTARAPQPSFTWDLL